jgi:hypothetical protein
MSLQQDRLQSGGLCRLEESPNYQPHLLGECSDNNHPRAPTKLDSREEGEVCLGICHKTQLPGSSEAGSSCGVPSLLWNFLVT